MMDFEYLTAKELGLSLPICITELPQEILHKIFEYLDVKSLKSSRTVDKKWNHVRNIDY